MVETHCRVPASEYFSLLARRANTSRSWCGLDHVASAIWRGMRMGRRRRVVRSSTLALGGWHVTTAWPAGHLGSNCMACWAGGCRRLHGLLGLHPHESLQAGNSRPGGAEYKNLRGGRCRPPGSDPLSEGENSRQRPSQKVRVGGALP